MNYNPHCKQLSNTNRGKYQYKRNVLELKLREDSEKTDPPENAPFAFSTVDWPEMERVMAYIFFLTNFAEKEDIVVCVQSAPGLHIRPLTKMFPSLKWYLVDENPFTIYETPSVKIVRESFGKETIVGLKEYMKGRKIKGKILMISDLILWAGDCVGYQRCDKITKDLMRLQEKWVLALRPSFSLLKFDIGSIGVSVNYLKGELRKPVFGRHHTEFLLVVDSKEDFSLKEYKIKRLEKNGNYFQQVERALSFPHDVQNQFLDHCFDCSASIRILSEYEKKYSGGIKDYNSVDTLFNYVSTSVGGPNSAGKTSQENYLFTTRKGILSRNSFRRLWDQ